MNKPRFANKVILSSFSILLSACGIAAHPSEQNQWLADGSIALYREVKTPPPIPISATSLHTFAPISADLSEFANQSINQIRISLNRSSQALMIRGLGAAPVLVPVEGASQLSELSPQKIILKQENPLWYAPDSYFTKRGIAVPAPFAEERFRRGALGAFALFLEGGIPIHTGPFWSEEVGGLRISEEAGAALFAAIPLGTSIE
jgi:hypothetical protein